MTLRTDIRTGLTALLAAAAVALVAATAVVARGDEPEITVQESAGTFTVGATFTVEAPADKVREVLTDYAGIPRYMPNVRSSRILDREASVVRVEQHATAKFMMFSRDIHLVLLVEEGDAVIRFGDTAGTSFRRYEGAWTLTPAATGTTVTYSLSARPAFSVPGFVLRRLLDRDARLMIERLRTEIAARAEA